MNRKESMQEKYAMIQLFWENSCQKEQKEREAAPHGELVACERLTGATG